MSHDTSLPDADQPGEPALDGDLLATLQLAHARGVGPRLFRSLVEHFGTPRAVLDAPRSELRTVAGVGPKLAEAIAKARNEFDPNELVDEARRHDVRVLVAGRPGYPQCLDNLPDAPLVLFARGALEPGDALAVAIVGSRHATRYGLEQADRLAQSLSRAGLCIVSGLARGIDAAAHRGALAAGGRTIAVLGSGLLEIYPPEHVDLAGEVAAQGIVLSETPLCVPPAASAFPQRNRLISGLSLGAIVVEASDRSGALITARHAMEQGREVFAVPGRVDSRMSRGCHRLIRDGAKLVETADDVLEELGPLALPVRTEAADGAPANEIHHPAELLLNPLERQVLDAVRSDATPIDEVVRTSGLPTPQVLSAISVLEMRRMIRRLSGTTVLRV